MYYILIPRKCPHKTLFQHTVGGGVKNWSKLLTDSTKKLPTRERGCQNSGKIADVVYRWSQSQKEQDSIVGLKILQT